MPCTVVQPEGEPPWERRPAVMARFKLRSLFGDLTLPFPEQNTAGKCVAQ